MQQKFLLELKKQITNRKSLIEESLLAERYSQNLCVHFLLMKAHTMTWSMISTQRNSYCWIDCDLINLLINVCDDDDDDDVDFHWLCFFPSRHRRMCSENRKWCGSNGTVKRWQWPVCESFSLNCNDDADGCGGNCTHQKPSNLFYEKSCITIVNLFFV